LARSLTVLIATVPISEQHLVGRKLIALRCPSAIELFVKLSAAALFLIERLCEKAYE
jgi:hypothetical protein